MSAVKFGIFPLKLLLLHQEALAPQRDALVDQGLFDGIWTATDEFDQFFFELAD